MCMRECVPGRVPASSGQQRERRQSSSVTLQMWSTYRLICSQIADVNVMYSILHISPQEKLMKS